MNQKEKTVDACCHTAEPNEHKHHQATQADDLEQQSLAPLFVIVGYIVGGTALVAFVSKEYTAHALMSSFMGAFFLAFSLFKMINLKGFAEAYATYDLLAARSRLYALSYPFIELLLGIAYVLRLYPLGTNIITFGLMTFGSIGVSRALRSNQPFQCACLGTALKLPMTKITLIENLLMAFMALMGILAAIS